MKTSDTELLIKAIDNYDILTPSHRKVLKILVELCIDDQLITTTIKLSKISGFSRTLIYQALEVFKHLEFIEITTKDKNQLNAVVLKFHKLNDIIKHYELEQETKKKYRNVKNT